MGYLGPISLLFFHLGAAQDMAFLSRQHGLAHAHGLGGDLQQLVIADLAYGLL